MKGYPVGFARAMCGFTDANGVFIGKAATLTAGSSSGAYVLDNVKTAALSVVAETALQIQGGDRIKGIITFGQPRMQAFDLTVSDLDTDLIALITQSTPNTTNTKRVKYGYNPNRAFPQVMFWALQQRYVLDDGIGTEKVITTYFPRAETMIKRGQYQFRGESDSVIRITPKTVSKSHTGQSFGSGANNLAFGFEQDKADYYEVATDYPVHLMAYKRPDALTATFNSDYKPVSNVITLNATGNEFIAAGVPTALTSFSTTTNAAVIPAGGAANDVCVLEYETNYVP